MNIRKIKFSHYSWKFIFLSDLPLRSKQNFTSKSRGIKNRERGLLLNHLVQSTLVEKHDLLNYLNCIWNLYYDVLILRVTKHIYTLTLITETLKVPIRKLSVDTSFGSFGIFTSLLTQSKRTFHKTWRTIELNITCYPYL